MKPRFKAGQLIHLVGNPKDIIQILHVGKDKYFVRHPYGTEGVIKINSTDTYYQRWRSKLKEKK